jgi:dipeptidase E
VDTATSLDAVALDLDAYDGVFMGGGNTFLLVHRLRETGLASRLVRSIQEGLPCYGGSAGAIALGAHIGTCAHLDSDDIGLTDLRGLDLVGGCAVWCHYRSSDAARVRAFGRHTQTSVLTLSENAGFSFDGAELTPIGPGTAKLWAPTAP